MSARVWQLQESHPDPYALQEAAQALRAGQVVVFPTETVYGIGALASQPAAIERVYEIKQRSREKPLTCHIASLGQLPQASIAHEKYFHYLAHRLWPGPVTIIVKQTDGATQGIRFPEHRLARQLIERCGEPLLATSANRSGEEPIVKGSVATAVFHDTVDVILDSGTTLYQQESTIIDLTMSPCQIVREGSHVAEVQQAIENFELFGAHAKKILLVCTGNTCRSPMAEGWLRHTIAKRGLEQEVHIRSGGIAALEGGHPATEAIAVTKAVGIDIAQHIVRDVTDDDVRDATHIFAMEENHKAFILERHPEFESKITVLNVADPIGLSQEAYANCFADIRRKLEKELAWIAV